MIREMRLAGTASCRASSVGETPISSSSAASTLPDVQPCVWTSACEELPLRRGPPDHISPLPGRPGLSYTLAAEVDAPGETHAVQVLAGSAARSCLHRRAGRHRHRRRGLAGAAVRRSAAAVHL